MERPGQRRGHGRRGQGDGQDADKQGADRQRYQGALLGDDALGVPAERLEQHGDVLLALAVEPDTDAVEQPPASADEAPGELPEALEVDAADESILTATEVDDSALISFEETAGGSDDTSLNAVFLGEANDHIRVLADFIDTVSTASHGRQTCMFGIMRKVGICSTAWCVGPSSPSPIESWV